MVWKMKVVVSNRLKLIWDLEDYSYLEYVWVYDLNGLWNFKMKND